MSQGTSDWMERRAPHAPFGLDKMIQIFHSLHKNSSTMPFTLETFHMARQFDLSDHGYFRTATLNTRLISSIINFRFSSLFLPSSLFVPTNYSQANRSHNLHHTPTSAITIATKMATDTTRTRITPQPNRIMVNVDGSGKNEISSVR